MIILKLCEEKIWEKDINNFFHSVFHTTDWLNTVQTKFFTPIYIDFYKQEEKVGKISGVIIKNSFIKGKELYFYAGPALKELDKTIYNYCLKAIYSYAKKKRYCKINIGSYDNKHSLKSSIKSFIVTKRIEYVIPINDGLPSIKFGSQFKRNLKKSKKITPEHSHTNSQTSLCKLNELIEDTHRERTKKNGVKYDHFYLRNFNNQTLQNITQFSSYQIHAAMVDKKTHCMELAFSSPKFAYMLLKGSDNFSYLNGLSAFLTTETLKTLGNNGIKYYNLGGRPDTPDGDGLARFKKNSGAEEIICYGASTNYICWPQKVINPLLSIGRKLPKHHPIVEFLKKHI